MLKKTLELDSNFAAKVHYEEYTNFKNSFFMDVYDDAASVALDIINETRDYHNKNRSNNTLNKINGNFETMNNTINFIGNRGTGKTSAMLSFAGFLSLNSFNYDGNIVFNDEQVKLKELLDRKKHGCKFIRLDSIDPSLMDSNESIFEVVVAKLYGAFDKDIDGNHSNYNANYGEQRKLAEQFAKIFEAIKYNSQPLELFKQETNPLEALSKLSSSENIRMEFINLVEQFLKYKCKTSDDEDSNVKNKINDYFLVIPLDDLDLVFESILKFSEEIRRYLMIPNVILLTTFKMKQYSNLLMNAYIKKDEIRKDKTENENSSYYRNIAFHYLDKSYPVSHRLYMPSLFNENYVSDDTILIRIVKPEGEPKNLRNEALNRNTGLSINTLITKSIYNKTLQFLPFKPKRHMLFPSNIRELQGILKEFDSYNDLYRNNTEKDSERVVKNLKDFITYLEEYWARKNINEKYFEIVQHAFEKPNTNEYICCEIKKIIESKIGNDSHTKTFLEDFASYKLSRGEGRYTVGDVVHLSNYIKHFDEQDERFTYIIQVLYSAYLTKLTIGDDNKLTNLKDFTRKDLYGKLSIDLLPRIKTSGKKEDWIIISRIMGITKFSYSFEELSKYVTGNEQKLDNIPEDVKAEYNALEIISLMLIKPSNETFNCKKAGENDYISYEYGEGNAIPFYFDVLNMAFNLLRYEDILSSICDMVSDCLATQYNINKNEIKSKIESISIKKSIDSFILYTDKDKNGNSTNQKRRNLYLFLNIGFISHMVKYVNKSFWKDHLYYIENEPKDISKMLMHLAKYSLKFIKNQYKKLFNESEEHNLSQQRLDWAIEKIDSFISKEVNDEDIFLKMSVCINNFLNNSGKNKVMMTTTHDYSATVTDDEAEYRNDPINVIVDDAKYSNDTIPVSENYNNNYNIEKMSEETILKRISVELKKLSNMKSRIENSTFKGKNLRPLFEKISIGNLREIAISLYSTVENLYEINLDVDIYGFTKINKISFEDIQVFKEGIKEIEKFISSLTSDEQLDNLQKRQYEGFIQELLLIINTVNSVYLVNE